MPARNLAEVIKKNAQKVALGQFNRGKQAVLGQSRGKVIREADKYLGRYGIPAREMASELFSTAYQTTKNSFNGIFGNLLQGFKIEFFGMVSEANNQVPREYLVNISDKNDFRNELINIVGILQESVELKTEGDWGPFSVLRKILPEEALELIQATTKKSLIGKFTSRRVWKGTSPIMITLPLKFEAVKDANTEVMIPVKKLQQLALPDSLGVTGDFFLTPPGPSPFKDPGLIKKFLPQKAVEYIGKGEEINVSIGRFLQFKSVVVKEVTATFDNRISQSGYPIGATVNITFQTYEILTKPDLDKVFLNTGATWSNSAQQTKKQGV